MKRLLSLAFALMLNSVIHADALATDPVDRDSIDDTAVMGTVEINVKPNVLVILDNSASMKEIEGPIGAYDPNTEYYGEYDADKVYYRRLGINKKLKPLALKHQDLSKVECSNIKDALSSTGQWEGTAYIHPGSIIKCETGESGACGDGYTNRERSFFTGNYLNWYYYGLYDQKYDSEKTYKGSFTKDYIYKDFGENTGDAIKIIEDRPDPENMGFSESDLTNAHADLIAHIGNVEKNVSGKGYWFGLIDGNGNLHKKDGIYYPHFVAGGKLFASYSVYSGNYLNWHFYRTTDSYESLKKYDGGFDRNKFYFRSQAEDPASDYIALKVTRKTPKDYSDGVPHDNDTSNIACTDVTDGLKDDHMWSGSLCVYGVALSEDYKCGTIVRKIKDYHFYSGNYLNYYYERRIDLAKRIMRNVLERRTDLRLGLMTMHDFVSKDGQILQDGGEIVSFIKDDDNVEFLQKLKSVQPIDRLHSPLAECLAEAGLYFAGKTGWYNNVSYTSPIKAWCQNNFVVILSDGASLSDQDYKLWLSEYICGGDWDTDTSNDYIRDYDGDGQEWGPLLTNIKGGYLDDVAYYLYKNDIFKDSGLSNRAKEEKKQNVRTYTIGFKMDSILTDWVDTNRGLLDKAARQGGGKFTEASDVPSLERAISSVMNSVDNISSSYVTASVPISSSNKNYSGAYAYVAQFYPPSENKNLDILEDEGRWIGNLKKFPIDDDGNFQAKPVDAWSGSDSDKVEEGGVRSKMLNKKSIERKIYFGTESKEFKVDNLGKDKTKTPDDESNRKLVTDIRCGSNSGACKDDKPGYYIMGDIIHFAPLVWDYSGATGKRIFVGANDGMLHCFGDDGDEKWAYIPEPHLGRIKNLTPEGLNSGSVNKRTYYIDGGRTLYNTKAKGSDKSKSLLIFGERRGGNNYYGLDITAPDSPKLEYTLSPGDSFGESWSNPRVVPIIHNENMVDVFWIGGGYDSDNQHRFKKGDSSIKPADIDAKGKGVYAVDATTGRIIEGLADNSGIDNCILDPVCISPGYAGGEKDGGVGTALTKAEKEESCSRLYACDMWGRLWGFRQDDDLQAHDESSDLYSHLPGERSGNWKKYPVFTTGDKQRKAFHRPEVVLETFMTKKLVDGKIQKHEYQGEYVYFGTGDREHPSSVPEKNDEGNQNRFYAIKNMWDSGAAISEASTSDGEKVLVDITGTQNGASSLKALDSYPYRGWFLRLTNKGEKVVSNPLAYRGMVFFTTYTPVEKSSETKDNTNSECSGTNALGVARLYALNYKTGEAVLDFDTMGLDKDGQETSDSTKITKKLSKSDRSIEIGYGMPGAPSLIFPKNGGSKIMVGVGNKIFTQDLNVRDMTVYYWKEKR